MTEFTEAIGRVAVAITPRAAGGPDAAGGHVESLTEAVMGITAGLVEVAASLESIAEAIRERSRQERNR